MIGILRKTYESVKPKPYRSKSSEPWRARAEEPKTQNTNTGDYSSAVPTTEMSMELPD